MIVPNPGMGFLLWSLGFCISFIVFLSHCPAAAAAVVSEDGGTVEGTVSVDGETAIGSTCEHFICATLDWWPPQKCDYGKCSWGLSSLLNLDLGNPILLSAVKAFSPLKIRVGGSLQDKVIYQTEDQENPCTPFLKNVSEIFGFSSGCLTLSRWDELNHFFNKSGALVVFGLNALNGRSIRDDGYAAGPWDSSNAESFIRYTVRKRHAIRAWELGNELSGGGVGMRVDAGQYAEDMVSLKKIVEDVYKDIDQKPLVVAPGGFFDVDWFGKFFDNTVGSLDVVTRHIYNLGPGVDDHLIEKILDPSYLDRERSAFEQMQGLLKTSKSKAESWVGESGGAYNSGRDHVSNAFVFGFWYLDQLGMASLYGTKTYCRQSLVGGNYGLLDAATFLPNPDYYGALLWHRLMGKTVLPAKFSGPKMLRVYAHCAKRSTGITLLLLNLDKKTKFKTRLSLLLKKDGAGQRPGTGMVKRPMRDGCSRCEREEYHLSAKDRDLQGRMLLLNGKPVTVTSSGNIPPLKPVKVPSSDPITVQPLSTVFVHAPYFTLTICP